ncbi:tetratricopeptide repeat protein [Myxococcota bacterium]|nr:tetratricopeptide repeat protein [Myxococcota bacterium]
MYQSDPGQKPDSLRWRWLDRLTLAALFSAVIALSVHKIIAVDFWWQYATGGWILENGLPRLDPFSFAFPDRPWIELRWLYYLLIHGIAAVSGLNGLILAKTALIVIAFLVLAKTMRAGATWVRPLGLLCALILIYPRLRLRPEVMSFLWLSATLLCLDQYKRRGQTGWLLSLPLIQILWANTHTLSILGPVLLWTSVICEATQGTLAHRWNVLTGDLHPVRGRRLTALTATAVLLSLCGLATPYFLDGALYPVTLWQQIQAGSDMSLMIDELRSPLLDGRLNFQFMAYLGVLWVSSASFLLCPQRFVLTRLAWWTGFLLLSLLSTRNASLFGIVAGVVLTANLREWLTAPRELSPAPRWLYDGLPGMARAITLTLSLALCLSAATNHFWRSQRMPHAFGFGVVEERFPIRAWAFIEEQGLPRPVMGDLSDGGYLLYRGGERSVFLDGRLEVYGQDLLGNLLTQLETPEGYLQILDEQGLNTAVLRHLYRMDVIAALEQHPEWIAVYFDEAYAAFVRLTPNTQAKLQELAIDWSDPIRPHATPPRFDTPANWLDGVFPQVPDASGVDSMAKLLITMGSLRAARDAYEQAVDLRPDDPHYWLHLGLLRDVLGDPVGAGDALSRVEPKTLERPDVRAAHEVLNRKRAANCQSRIARHRESSRPETRPPDHGFDLGACFHLMGDVEAARRVWTQVIEKAPHHAQAQASLARLTAAP